MKDHRLLDSVSWSWSRGKAVSGCSFLGSFTLQVLQLILIFYKAKKMSKLY